MKAEANEFLARLRLVCSASEFERALVAAGEAVAGFLGERGLGAPVTDRRSSWVRHLQISSLHCYVKTYDYPTVRDRLRGATRNTLFGRSRARREWDALHWLRAHDFDGPAPLAVLEERHGGLLRRAVLVTEAWPGEDLAVLLPRLDAGERAALLRAVDGLVARLHDAGFRDRNLDPRNILAQRDPSGGYRVAKIDSPRHALVTRGSRRARRLARADIARLDLGLAALGVQRARA